MAGRPSVNRVTQIGVETTPGTAVGGSKSLPSTTIELTRELDVKQYRALGYKAQTTTKITKDFSSGKMSAPFSYTEIVYPLAGMVTPVITTPASGVLTRDWTFTSLATGADAFKTFSMQTGDGTAAELANYCLFTQFGIDLKEDEATINGTVLGRALTSGSLTGSPTTIAQLPIGPREIDIYIDPIGGTAGTTAVTDALNASFSISNKYAAKWVLSTSQASWKEPIEVVPSLTAEILTEHNAQSRGFYDAITSASNPYYLVRMRALGPAIETVAGPITYYNTVTLDFAAQIIATQWQDSSGVYAYKYTLLPEYHATPGNRLWQIVVRTTLTAL